MFRLRGSVECQGGKASQEEDLRSRKDISPLVSLNLFSCVDSPLHGLLACIMVLFTRVHEFISRLDVSVDSFHSTTVLFRHAGCYSH